MPKLVRDTSVHEILNNWIELDTLEALGYEDDEGEDLLPLLVYRCKICNATHFELKMDALEHIINCHMDEELPEAYNPIDDSDDYTNKKPQVTKIDPDELELY